MMTEVDHLNHLRLNHARLRFFARRVWHLEQGTPYLLQYRPSQLEQFVGAVITWHVVGAPVPQCAARSPKCTTPERSLRRWINIMSCHVALGYHGRH